MYSAEDKNQFFLAVDSLKKYRRAELKDDQGKELIELLYTDLLPDDQILKSCLSNNTTFLIGRKGTGKSTIFLRLQKEYRKKGNVLSCYIDTKTVFESSQAEYISHDYLDEAIPSKYLNKYVLEKNFIQSVLRSLIEEVSKKTTSTMEKLKKILGLSAASTVLERVKLLQNSIENNDHLKMIEMPTLRKKNTHKKVSQESVNEREFSHANKFSGSVKLSELDFGVDAEEGFNRGDKLSSKNNLDLEEEFSDIFLKVFQVKNFIDEIKDILSILNIKSLVVLLDDFSEIPDESKRVFVDVLLAPLNNWSDEFIKFKVAAYPNRVYFGKIDQGKIDKIYLDFYDLYSTRVNKSVMEEKSVDFTKRLIEKRINHFTSKPIEHFFDTKKDSIDDYYELIFQISMNIPRIIGYILYYCYESKIAYNSPITKAALEDAAEKYYDFTIEPFFHNTTYSLKSIDEKISILQLKELMDIFIAEMKEIQKKIRIGELTSVLYEPFRHNPFASHFYFNPLHEQFIRTLELNFFISKYNEMSSKDGGKQSVYCLNYGLCKKNSLKWGYPKGTEYRKYLVSRPFDFDSLIEMFLKKSKSLSCINPACHRSFPFEELEFLKFTKMRCPDCQSPVKEISTADSLRSELERIDNAKLLPEIEIGIMHEMHKTEKPMKAKEIAEELDCSYQLIGKRAKKLDETLGLVARQGESAQRVYSLTNKAKQDYFPDND